MSNSFHDGFEKAPGIAIFCIDGVPNKNLKRRMLLRRRTMFLCSRLVIRINLRGRNRRGCGSGSAGVAVVADVLDGFRHVVYKAGMALGVVQSAPVAETLALEWGPAAVLCWIEGNLRLGRVGVSALRYRKLNIKAKTWWTVRPDTWQSQ